DAVECAGGSHGELLRRSAGLVQNVRHHHGEAGGVGSGDQLLRAGLAIWVFGAGGEGYWKLPDRAAANGHRAAALGEITVPDHFCASLCQCHDVASYWLLACILLACILLACILLHLRPLAALLRDDT